MSLYEVFQIISLTTLVVKRTCKGTGFGMVRLVRRKKVSRFKKERWRSAQKTIRF